MARISEDNVMCVCRCCGRVREVHWSRTGAGRGWGAVEYCGRAQGGGVATERKGAPCEVGGGVGGGRANSAKFSVN